MTKIILTTLDNLENQTTAVNVINSNSDTLTTAFDNTLSRDGTQPNQMEATLDMNSNRIINLPAPINGTEPVRLKDINPSTTGPISFSSISGTLLPSQMPNPTATTLGGVKSYTSPAHQWINAISTTGQPSSTQPSFADISGIISVGQLPSLTSSVASYVTRTAAIAATIASSVFTVITTGYVAAQDGGGAVYTRLASAPGTVRAWHFQSADGTYWFLQGTSILPRQVGAKLDGTTDDTTAIQAWCDYSVNFNVTARDQVGVALIPTATINTASGCNIQGSNLMTIRKGSNTVAPLMGGTGVTKVNVRGITIDTTSGFTSSSSNSVVSGTQVFTVAAGLGLSASSPTNNIQITSLTSPVNYMIAQITGYSGTTLTINTVPSNAIGSGTFSSWQFDVYPVNGNLTPSNIGLQYISSTNINIEDCTVNGRFYNGIDVRNTSVVYINNNRVTGHVNRGIAAQCYTTLVNNVVISNNNIDGSNLAQYGIVTGAVASGALVRLRIEGNAVTNCLFQGISMGGSVTNSTMSNNTVSTSATFGTNAFLVDLADSLNPQFITVTGNTSIGGLNGVTLVNAFYVSVVGNTVVGAAGNGFLLSGVVGISVTGNIAEGCSAGFTGTGSGVIITGCAAIACSTTYTVSGATLGSNI